MNFCEVLNSDIDKITSIYDLAAYCYDYLIKSAKNQALFIAKYIWENTQAEQCNPNLALMQDMQCKIKSKLDDYAPVFDDYSHDMCSFISEYEGMLETYGDDETLNHAVVPFFVIKGVELYVSDNNCDTRSDRAPLNKTYQTNSYIYLNEPYGIMHELTEYANYAQEIKANEIRDEIEHFAILEKKDVDGYCIPAMVTLHKSQNYLESLLRNHIIKVALVPFANAEMMHFPVKSGAVFEVECAEWHRRNAKDRALDLLNAAIAQEANIVIFPEYVCSPDIQDAISNHLKNIYDNSPEKLQNLLLVVAGSGWTEDSNNVAKIYSCEGICLGTHYKYSAYSDVKSKGMMEGLTSPGKETTIIRIPKIGNIQIDICRDISVATFGRRLARIFSPVFLLIPAWSPSVKIGFYEQLKTIISENHKTCAVLCNCCEAFRESKTFREEISVIITPCKNGSVVEGKETFICRTMDKCNHCSDYGCFYSSIFDFTVSDGKYGVTVGDPLQIFPE